MSPVEILINGHYFGETGPGPSVITLPNPPEGEVAWDGDVPGSGQIIAGPKRICKEFRLKEIGDEEVFDVAERTSGLFKTAANTISRVLLRRI